MEQKPTISAAELELLQKEGLDEATIKVIAKAKGQQLPAKSVTDQWLDKFITVHQTMLKVKDVIRKLAPLDDCVLITGETGTGKELLANALHGNRTGKFVAINCASMPENLLEDELFGHESGAFTGATKVKAGLLKYAARGTIFLDEIGEMPLLLQSKLLRAIQERVIRKVGGHDDEEITCRFIGATNRRLDSMIENFREDLYYRIATFEIATLPLGIRLCDVEPIAKSLCNNLPDEFIRRITPKHLLGNVRSLQRVIRRYLVLGEMPE